jgi:murein DD-endopeptidase MepM/ murein hydrolase activator NlpD
MKKSYGIFILIIIFVASVLMLSGKLFSNQGSSQQDLGESLGEQAIAEQQNSFQPPINRASERVTKKQFGTFVSPGNSPVKPERFFGYHTGSDFEIFPEEENTDVQIKAVCNGKMLSKSYATGYGGVLVQSCELEGSPITVIYGHLKLSSVSKKIGDNVSAGDALGILGKGYSDETNGERKHLHLGFHKGNVINLLGYVNTQEQLIDGWIDPCQYVCHD